MFLHVSVNGGGAIPACIAGGIPAVGGGACSRGVPAPGVSAPGGCLLWGVPAPGGCLLGEGGVETPPKTSSYCCRRYASYWNAFLLTSARNTCHSMALHIKFIGLILDFDQTQVGQSIRPRWQFPFNALLAIIVKHGVQVREWACCVKYCWGVYEQNSVVNSCPCRWLDSQKGDHC